MTGRNVQCWDDVYDLPWREAFEMSCPPESDAPDTRSLGEVVAGAA